MYFNQSATLTVTHLSTNQHQTIPKKKNKAATNPYQHPKQKKKKKKAHSTTKHQPKAAWKDCRERIEEEKKIRPWLKPSIEKLWRRH